MDRTTQQSTHSGGMHPSRPSPLSYSFQHEALSSYPEEQYLYGANEMPMKNRSCLPGYPNQRSSTSSNSTNARRAQQLRLASTIRSNHRDVDTLLTDEILMMNHLAIAPSASMPTHTSMNVQDNRDLYRNHRDRHHSSSHLLSPRGNSQNRRSRHASSSISRSATAALATPRSSSSSRGRSGTYHHPSASSSQQYSSNSTASTGSRYNNYPNGVDTTTTSTSPSKRSSSRISFSSQLSSTTTALSIHDIDDSGTVSTRRSENNMNNHRHHNNPHHHKPPSPMTDTRAAMIGKTKASRKDLNSNLSIGSATTKSSSGTNAMGNTKASTQRRSNTQSSALSPDPRLTAAMSSTRNPSLDVDTMKNHVQETKRVIDGKYSFLVAVFLDSRCGFSSRYLNTKAL